MSQRSLGKAWTQASPAEQKEFVRLFGGLIANAYMGRIEQYAGEPITYVGERIEGDDARVQSRVVTPKGSEVPIEYRLYRSTDDRILAGVCGGLAEHLTIDVRAVRIAFVVLAFVGGTGLILYAAFWAIVPQRSDASEAGAPKARSARRRPDRGDLVALCVLAGGVVLLVRQSGLWVGDAFVWPVLAAAVGVAIIWHQADESQRRRWAASARAPLTERPARIVAARLAAGVVLVAASVLWLLISQDGLRAATRGLLAVSAAVPV